MRTFFGVWFWVVVAGCSAELHHGLNERDANEMVVVLESNGIEASKEPDARDPLLWTVSVPHDVRVDAWSALSKQGLPRPSMQGFGHFYPRDALVPSTSEERILMQYATAQELRQTLILVDGVVDAQVNLVIPEQPRIRLSNELPPSPRASVLLKVQTLPNETPPIHEQDVKRVIAGAVDRMQIGDVEVLFSSVVNPIPHDLDSKVTQVGPIAVIRSGKFALQAIVGALFTIIMVLVAAVFFLVWRRK